MRVKHTRTELKALRKLRGAWAHLYESPDDGFEHDRSVEDAMDILLAAETALTRNLGTAVEVLAIWKRGKSTYNLQGEGQ